MKTETLQPNYIDELLMMRTDLSGTPDDYYCSHDHFYSVVGIYDDSGLAVERYLYDAYGTAAVLDADFSADADGISDIGNARLFHGKYLARFDSGDCEFYYYPYRDYSPTLGRWYQHEKLGMIPNDNKKINPFAVQAQYSDGMNLYLAFGNEPINVTDKYGLACCYKVGICYKTLIPEINEGMFINGVYTRIETNRYEHHDVRLEEYSGKGCSHLLKSYQKGFFANSPKYAVIKAWLSGLGIPTGWVDGSVKDGSANNCSMSIIDEKEYKKIKARFDNFRPTKYHLTQFNCHHWAEFVLSGQLLPPGVLH